MTRMMYVSAEHSGEPVASDKLSSIPRGGGEGFISIPLFSVAGVVPFGPASAAAPQSASIKDAISS